MLWRGKRTRSRKCHRPWWSSAQGSKHASDCNHCRCSPGMGVLHTMTSRITRRARETDRKDGEHLKERPDEGALRAAKVPSRYMLRSHGCGWQHFNPPVQGQVTRGQQPGCRRTRYTVRQDVHGGRQHNPRGLCLPKTAQRGWQQRASGNMR